MPIILTSISGGITDDYAGDDGYAVDKTFPNAAIENNSYFDLALVTPEPGYVSVASTSVSITSTIDYQIALNELTTGTMNSTFSNTPATNPFAGTFFSAGSPTISFNGTIENIFNDFYWVTRNLETYEDTTKTSARSLTTEGEESLYLLKPTYVRYSYRTYRVSSVHVRSNGSTATFTYNIIKRIMNLWEENRLKLKDIVNQQTTYFLNN